MLDWLTVDHYATAGHSLPRDQVRCKRSVYFPPSLRVEHAKNGLMRIVTPIWNPSLIAGLGMSGGFLQVRFTNGEKKSPQRRHAD